MIESVSVGIEHVDGSIIIQMRHHIQMFAVNHPFILLTFELLNILSLLIEKIL